MAIILTVLAGPHAGRSFTFQGHDTFLVGRSEEAHLSLPQDPYFSRAHFLIELNPPLARLLDLNSHNGTLVNGQRTQSVDLRDGDEIRAGQTTLRVAIPDSVGPAGATQTLPPALPGTDHREPTPSPGRELASLACQEQRRCWDQGRRVPAEDYLAAWPALAADPQAVLELIQGELRLRRERGESPPDAEYYARFPGYAEALRRRLALQRMLESNSSVTVPPLDTVPTKTTAEWRVPSLPGYVLHEELGRGAMGVVYRATRQADAASMAIKMVRPARCPNPIDLQRFLREIGILRRLQHPHIVHLHESGEAEGVLYFVMDRVEGKDAARLVSSEGPLPTPRAIRLGCQLLEALGYAHGQGFVHRDVKPANLLITTRAGEESVRLVDFGLGRAYQESQLSGLTMTGAVGGTPAFMAPEQILDFRTVKPAADQYAAAATIYNLLTGKTIYESTGHIHDLFRRILTTEPTPLFSHRPDLPESLARVLHRALDRQPAKRFPDVLALQQALLPFARG